MKFDIKVYVNGKLKGHTVSDDDFDWNWLERITRRFHRYYIQHGYKEILGSTEGYNVYFNEKAMKSTVVSYKKAQFLDFTDAADKPIIEGKIYRGALQGQKFSDEQEYDRYQVNSDWKDRLYIRNITRSDSHVVDWYGHPMMSPTVPDKYDFDQQYIDTLNLKEL